MIQSSCQHLASPSSSRRGWEQRISCEHQTVTSSADQIMYQEWFRLMMSCACLKCCDEEVFGFESVVQVHDQGSCITASSPPSHDPGTLCVCAPSSSHRPHLSVDPVFSQIVSSAPYPKLLRSCLLTRLSITKQMHFTLVLLWWKGSQKLTSPICAHLLPFNVKKNIKSVSFFSSIRS